MRKIFFISLIMSILLLLLTGIDGTLGPTSTGTADIVLVVPVRIGTPAVDPKTGQIYIPNNMDKTEIEQIVIKDTKDVKIIMLMPKP